MIDLAVDGLYRKAYEEMRDWAQRALEAARPLGDRRADGGGGRDAGLRRDVHGARARRRGPSRRGRRAHRRDDGRASSPVRIDAIAHLGGAEFYLDRFDEAIAHSQRGLAVARATGQGHFFPMLTQAVGNILFVTGRLTEATETLESALESARLADNGLGVAWTLLNCAYTAVEAGDIDDALRAAEEADRADRRERPRHRRVGRRDPGLRAARGGRARARGRGARRLGRRRRRCRSSPARGGRPGSSGSRAAGSRSASPPRPSGRRPSPTRAPARSGCSCRARPPRAPRPRSRSTAATPRRRPSARWPRRRWRATRARASRPGVARTLAGRALAQAGERDARDGRARRARPPSSTPAARAATAIGPSASCARSATPSTAARAAGRPTAAASTSLSGRELEVARLVVDRRTNLEIAAELFLSIKTVETHMRNLFRKLDAQLAGRGRARDRARRARGRGRRLRSLVGRAGTFARKSRSPAPPGKDADPKESLSGFRVVEDAAWR